MVRIILVLFLLLTGCSFKKNQLENQTKQGHDELYSEPSEPKSDLGQGEKRIIIASTNDIHGHYSAHSIAFEDDHHKERQSIQVGGVHIIGSYFKILRNHYKNVLLVDSGDLFSDKPQELSFIQDFYSLLNYDAITVGLRDFNLRLPEKYSSSSEYFKEFAKKSSSPLIFSNLYELKTARVVEWPGTLPYLLRDINGVKVGVIGLIPDDIVAQTPVDNRIGLFVENMLQSTLRHARLLRSIGADLIVVLTHQGIECGREMSQEMKLPITKVNFEPHHKNICDFNGVLGDYLLRLPPNLVDVVVGGRNHQKTANFINGTLVMSGFPDGKGFSYAEFFFDTKTKKVIKEKTLAHQPIVFCHEFFKETKDCYTEDPSVDHVSRIVATFLGKTIAPDDKLRTKFSYYFNEIKTSESTMTQEETVASGLKKFQGDLAYIPVSEGYTQMISVEISGEKLSQILENDFNQGFKAQWFPNPFFQQGNALRLTINQTALDPHKVYKLIGDVESFQKHTFLKNLITDLSARTLVNASWNSLGESEDKIQSVLAAPGR